MILQNLHIIGQLGSDHNRGTKNRAKEKISLPFMILPGIFILYCITAGYTISHHELWGDELHSWNIAKASNSLFELISNTKYEGHPPLWYFILWTITLFTHDPTAMQVVHLFIACLLVFSILFYSPFPLFIRFLLPFGYFFIFEYSIISRNYSIGILLAFIICIIIHKQFKGKLLLYYFLLFLLANTHLLSLLLAASLHLYFLLLNNERTKSKKVIPHLLVGIIILLPAAYFIFPPSGSALSPAFWTGKWNIGHISAIIQSPLRAFMPIPDWAEYNFWDTHFMISKGHIFSLPMWVVSLFSVGFIFLCILLLRSNKKCLAFFLFNLSLVSMISIIIPFTNSRHIGFIFISLLVALWLYLYNNPVSKPQIRILLTLLLFQLIGGAVAVSKDIKYVFSNSYQVKELLKKIPNEKPVTDYWCLNTLSAFTGKSYYCTDLQKEVSFLLWNSELAAAIKKNNRYSSGILSFMKKEQVNTVFLLSTQRLEKLRQMDDKLFSVFTVKLIDKREGAIEKGSNLYFYKITSK